MKAALRERLERCTAARAEAVEREPARFEADPEWKAEALKVVRRLALERETLTVAAVVQQLPRLPADLRAVGAVMLAAARQGLVEADGWTPGGSRRHGRPVRVWQSRVYAGPGP